jgi:hypothetical protein
VNKNHWRLAPLKILCRFSSFSSTLFLSLFFDTYIKRRRKPCLVSSIRVKMARLAHNNNNHKHTYTKTVVLLSCVGLFGIALFVDFMWAFSSSSSSSVSAYLSVTSNWALEKSGIVVTPPHVNTTEIYLVRFLFLFCCLMSLLKCSI